MARRTKLAQGRLENASGLSISTMFIALAARYEEVRHLAKQHASWVRNDPALDDEDIVQNAFVVGLSDRRKAPSPSALALMSLRVRSAARDHGRRVPKRVLAHERFSECSASSAGEALEERVGRQQLSQAVRDLLSQLSPAEARRIRQYLDNRGERPFHWSSADRRAFSRGIERLRSIVSSDLLELFHFVRK